MSDAVVETSEKAIAKGSQSFAAAAKLFDRRTRDDAVMLYAWCRHCDDVIDGQEFGHGGGVHAGNGATLSTSVQMERLARLQTETRKALQGVTSADANFEALRRVVVRNEIDRLYPEQLLQGFAMDVSGQSYETIEDTLAYCYHVAGVVGVMMAMIMGARQPDVLDRASDLGIAFQLTNICRDIVDDAGAGRCYVPKDVLVTAGAYGPDAGNRARLFVAAKHLLALSEAYYASAYCGLPDLPFRSAWAVAAARRVYRAIGAKLLRQGPSAWDKRISTGKSAKLVAVVAGLGDAVVSRVYRSQHSRTGLFARPIG